MLNCSLQSLHAIKKMFLNMSKVKIYQNIWLYIEVHNGKII